jgi:hypothetical protein
MRPLQRRRGHAQVVVRQDVHCVLAVVEYEPWLPGYHDVIVELLDIALCDGDAAGVVYYGVVDD